MIVTPTAYILNDQLFQVIILLFMKLEIEEVLAVDKWQT